MRTSTTKPITNTDPGEATPAFDYSRNTPPQEVGGYPLLRLRLPL